MRVKYIVDEGLSWCCLVVAIINIVTVILISNLNSLGQMTCT